MTKPNQEVLLRIEHLTKSFNGFVANDDISFDIHKGEVHCLLGENGAGKSTLSECIFGYFKPDSGKIFFKDQLLDLNSPREAIDAGIGMVHQHFILAEPMTVAENIVVGTAQKGIGTNVKQAAARLENLCRQYDLDLDPYAKISTLSVGQQQWVEILKALYVGIDLLILDEPTAVLTPQESDQLFSILKKMTAEGLAILLITHKLYEVLNLSDRVTVLRKGRLIATVETKDMNRDDLARMMVGRVIDFKVQKEELTPGDVVLDIRELHARRDNGVTALDGLSLSVRQREIVGLAGVAGNGQKELYDAVVGVLHATGGQIKLGEEEITHLAPSEICSRGLAGIPPDRLHEGLVLNFSVEENLMLGLHNQVNFRKLGMFNQPALDRFAKESIAEFDIAVQSPSQKAKGLSGGNLQKVILARELSQHPKCVIASSPTRGLDVGAMEYVHKKLVELRSQGSGILLISEDLDEIFNVADLVAVIFKGKILRVCRVQDTTKGQVGLLMAGIQEGVA